MTKDDMIKRRDWQEFRSTGLLLFVNSFLNIFGWAMAVEIDDETNQIRDAYPVRTKFRGFSLKDQHEAHQKVAEYLEKNIAELKKETL